MKKLFYQLKFAITLVLAVLCTGLAAQYTVSGVVNDENGDPLIGVNVLVEGTSLGTVTDLDGSYTIDVASDPGILVFSYLGYASQSIEVSSDSNRLNISLEPSASTLDEIVVTGLATSIKRSNLANAVASISAKELVGVAPQNTVDGALYGKFKGADIRANSGAPGGGFSVRLRGVTSVFLNQQPQYIIDGVYIDNSAISLGTDIVTAAAGGAG